MENSEIIFKILIPKKEECVIDLETLVSDLRTVNITLRHKLRPKFRPKLKSKSMPTFRPKNAMYKAHFFTVEIKINLITERVKLFSYNVTQIIFKMTE